MKVKYAINLEREIEGREASEAETVEACLARRGISRGGSGEANVVEEVRRSFPFSLSGHLFLARSAVDRAAWLAAVAMATGEAATLREGLERVGVVETGPPPVSPSSSLSASPSSALSPSSSLSGRTMLHISQATDFEPSSDEEE